MATLCRLCADEAEPSVSLLDTSHHHLQWAIKRFDIELDDVLPTSVCSQCDNIILEWTLFLGRRLKARILFSTMIANQSQPASKVPRLFVPRTKRLQHPQGLHRILPRPHTSNTSVPSQPSTSGHSTASAPDLSLPQNLVTEYHIKDFSIKVPRLSDQVLDSLQQNVTVDCNVVDNQMSEQRNVRIKLEPVTVDACVSNDQLSDNLQQNLSSSEDDDDIEVPFEAIYVPVIRSKPDLVKPEPSSGLSAAQYENHHLADNTVVTVKQEEFGNAEEYSEVQPDLPEVETSPETSNPGSNKDVNINISVFNCAHCNFTTKSRSKITSHIDNQHVKMSRYQCQGCSKSFTYKKYLHKHIRHAHPNKYFYKCSLCKRRFKTEKHLNAHIKTHDEILECDVCGKILGSKQSLTEHKMTIHIKSSALPCNECSKIFYSDKSLKSHTKEVHSNLLYKCDICNKSYKLKNSFWRHKQYVHSTVHPFSCNQCEKTFVSKAQLKHHSLVHSDLRPFKCEHCNACFKLKPSLSFHIHTVHSNVSAFQCHLCGKSFKRKGNLTQHFISHSDVRNYKCEQCGKLFKTELKLKQHLKTHSETRPLVCSVSQEK